MLKKWLPYLYPIPREKEQAFLDQVMERYFHYLPTDSSGKAHFVLQSLEVEAVRTIPIQVGESV